MVGTGSFVITRFFPVVRVCIKKIIRVHILYTDIGIKLACVCAKF